MMFAIASSLIFIVLLYLSRQLRGYHRVLVLIAAAVTGLAIGLGVIPGFERINLGPISINSGKLVMGLALAFLLPSAWRWNQRCTILLITCLLVLPLAGILLGYVTWRPAISLLVLWFAIGNLVTVISEDFFFRRFIQDHLIRFGKLTEIMLTAALFGLVHLGGGIMFALLAAGAGIFYSATYTASRSVWAVVVVHLALNLTSALLFGLP